MPGLFDTIKNRMNMARSRAQQMRPNLLPRLNARINSGGPFFPRLRAMAGRSVAAANGVAVPAPGGESLFSTRFDSTRPDGGFRPTPQVAGVIIDPGSGYRATT